MFASSDPCIIFFLELDVCTLSAFIVTGHTHDGNTLIQKSFHSAFDSQDHFEAN